MCLNQRSIVGAIAVFTTPVDFGVVVIAQGEDQVQIPVSVQIGDGIGFQLAPGEVPLSGQRTLHPSLLPSDDDGAADLPSFLRTHTLEG